MRVAVMLLAFGFVVAMVAMACKKPDAEPPEIRLTGRIEPSIVQCEMCKQAGLAEAPDIEGLKRAKLGPIPGHVDAGVQSMDYDHAAAFATRIAGRLMECFGGNGAWACRPVGVSQTDIAKVHPNDVVHPIVTCIDGDCVLVRP